MMEKRTGDLCGLVIFFVMLSIIPVSAEIETCHEPGYRGDVDKDLILSIADGVSILRYLFMGEQITSCLERADVDENGRIELNDAVRLFNYLFRGGPSPGNADGNEDSVFIGIDDPPELGLLDETGGVKESLQTGEQIPSFDHVILPRRFFLTDSNNEDDIVACSISAEKIISTSTGESLEGEINVFESSWDGINNLFQNPLEFDISEPDIMIGEYELHVVCHDEAGRDGEVRFRIDVIGSLGIPPKRVSSEGIGCREGLDRCCKRLDDNERQCVVDPDDDVSTPLPSCQEVMGLGGIAGSWQEVSAFECNVERLSFIKEKEFIPLADPEPSPTDSPSPSSTPGPCRVESMTIYRDINKFNRVFNNFEVPGIYIGPDGNNRQGKLGPNEGWRKKTKRDGSSTYDYHGGFHHIVTAKVSGDPDSCYEYGFAMMREDIQKFKKDRGKILPADRYYSTFSFAQYKYTLSEILFTTRLQDLDKNNKLPDLNQINAARKKFESRVKDWTDRNSFPMECFWRGGVPEAADAVCPDDHKWEVNGPVGVIKKHDKAKGFIAWFDATGPYIEQNGVAGAIGVSEPWGIETGAISPVLKSHISNLYAIIEDSDGKGRFACILTDIHIVNFYSSNEKKFDISNPVCVCIQQNWNGKSWDVVPGARRNDDGSYECPGWS